MDLRKASAKELAATVAAAETKLADLRGRNLTLDMTRGKPSPEQLTLSDDILIAVMPGETTGEDGTDYRNYGGLDGIPEAKRLFAELLETTPDRVVIGGNSSLSMMWDVLANAMAYGVPGGEGPWRDQGKIKMVCPVPGYDRHFGICERLGIDMVTVPMTADGPDLDAVRALLADPAVKAMWCVPKYSNPTGEVYSDTTVEALASMPAAAMDFRLMWDNAYAVHHLGEGPAKLRNIFDASEKAGNPDRAVAFVSTSKITHAGAGVAALGSSLVNVKDHLAKIGPGTIGPDKINQLRHVRFFGGIDGLMTHMGRQAELTAPKFQAVAEALERNLGGKGIASWTTPKGGYFVSVDVVPGTAKDVVRLCAEAGVKFTPAGSTYPHGNDPMDRNLRIAPTLPSVDEIRRAMQVFTAAIELTAAKKLGADMA